MKKSGVSAVIATVLIILITIVAIGVIWGLVIPMINDSVEGGVVDVDTEVSILIFAGYTVYDPEKHFAFVQVERGVDEENIEKLNFVFTIEGESVTYETLDAPLVNQKKTYSFNFTRDGILGTPTFVAVAPIFAVDGVGKITSKVEMPVKSARVSSGDDDRSRGNKPVVSGGSVISAIEIDSCEELQDINLDLSGDYKLTQSFSCSGTSDFKPIGNRSNKFNGTFDGQDFTISDLSINRPSEDYVGLFGYVIDGEIKNIGLVDVNIFGEDNVGGLVGASSQFLIDNSYVTGFVTGTDRSIGGLVGYSFSSSLISNSYAAVTVVGVYTIGGLVGDNYKSSIDNSYATGTVTGTGIETRAGGLVGYNRESLINNSYATGAVNGVRSVGGLVGSNVGSSVKINAQSLIINSYSNGTVAGTGFAVGGLAGYNSYSSIVNSYATGTVAGIQYSGGLAGVNHRSSIVNSYATGTVTGTAPATTFNYVGGLVGINYFSSSIDNSYATGTVIGTNGVEYSGGLAGYSSDSSINNSYATGAVTGLDHVGGLVGGSRSSNSVVGNSYWNNHSENPPVACGNDCGAIIIAIQDDEGWFYVDINAPMDVWDDLVWTWSGSDYPEFAWE